MTSNLPPTIAPGLYALDGERFELALDAHRGAITYPTGIGGLTLTSHRAIRHSAKGQRSSVIALSLNDIGGAELFHRSDLAKGLTRAGILFAAGMLLGVLSWLVFETPLFTVPLAGIPLFMAVFILSDALLSDSKSELLLYSAGAVLRQPLLTAAAERGASTLLQRLFALKYGVEPAPPPEAQPQPVLRDTPIATAPFGWTPVPPLEHTLPG